jgi:hypothetical protein
VRLADRALEGVEEARAHRGGPPIQRHEGEEGGLRVGTRPGVGVRGRYDQGRVAEPASREPIAELRDEARVGPHEIDGEPHEAGTPVVEGERARLDGIVHPARGPEPEGMWMEAEHVR